MSEINCNICRDLLPLVQDGVASPESEELVRAHIEECGECKAMFGNIPADNEKAPEKPPVTKGLKSAKRYLTVVYAAVMLLGLYVGLSLTAGEDMFFNTLIMPVAGALGYLAFRWRSLWIVPALTLIINFIANGLGLFAERLDILSILAWTFLYSLFALAGIIIAMLFHFAIFYKKNRDKKRTKALRIIALVVAIAATAWLILFAFSLNGNPVSYFLVTSNAKKYVAENYPGYEAAAPAYSFKDGTYFVEVTKLGSEDCHFMVKYGFGGNVEWDNYESAVEQGKNTAARLNMRYRELVDTVLESPSYPFNTDIGFGDLICRDDETHDFALDTATLIPDGIYDLNALAAEYGALTIYVKTEDISPEKAAEILVEIDDLMTQGGVTFKAIDLRLESDDRGSDFYIDNIHRDEISESNLVEIVIQKHNAYEARLASIEK